MLEPGDRVNIYRSNGILEGKAKLIHKIENLTVNKKEEKKEFWMVQFFEDPNTKYMREIEEKDRI